MWVIEISWVSDVAPCWRSPTPPLALPRPCPLDLLRLHLSTRPHTSALHHSALAPDRITRFPRVCLLLSKYSLLFNCSFQIPRSRRLACFTTRLTILYFLCFHLIYLCVLQRSQFFNYFCSLRLLFLSPLSFRPDLLFVLPLLWSSHFFFRLALEPHPSLQNTHPKRTRALRNEYTNTTSIVVQCNSIN